MFGGRSNSIVFPDGMIDAGNRLRTSEPFNLGEYIIEEGDPKSLLLQQVGTASFTVNTNSIDMSATAGQYGIVYTKQRHPYFAGNSQFLEMTCVGFGDQLGFEKSIEAMTSSTVAPYDSTLDGFRLYKDINNNRSLDFYNNGTLVKTLPRSQWIDKLDGTGPSKLNIDWDNFNVFAFDYLYLGGTAVACYIMHNRQLKIFAIYYHAGTYPGTIFQNPNKPIRYVLRADAGAVGSGSFIYVCSRVASEGTVNKILLPYVANDRGPLYTYANIGTNYAMFGVRKKSTRLNSFAYLETLKTMLTSVDQATFTILLNPTIVLNGGTFNYTPIANTPFEVAVPNSPVVTVTGGYSIDGSYGINTENNTSDNFDNLLARINSTIDGVSDSLVVTITPRTTTISTVATAIMKFK